MGKFYKMVDLSTDELKTSFYNLLNSKKSLSGVYKEFGLKDTPNNSVDLKKMAEEVGFDLSIYKERQSKPKKYCLQCGKELVGWQTKFCSNSCSATYSNTRRIISDETKQKTSNSIKLHYDKMGRKNISTKKCNICGDVECRDNFCKKHRQIIKTLIKYFEFDENVLGTGIDNVIREYNRIKSTLSYLYWDKGLSGREIMKLYPKYKDKPESNFNKILRSVGIDLRSLSEATILAHEMGRLSLPNVVSGFNSQWYTTWDNKEVYLRSSYEVEYAKQLDDQKIIYEVEGLRIKYFDTTENKYRCAIPDFYIKDENMIVEIKSSFTYDKQNMLDRFKAYKENGYNYKMIMDGKEYFENNLPENSNMTIKNCFEN